MRPDYEEIKAYYLSIKSDLEHIASKIEETLVYGFKEFKHLDRIGCRIKAETSFLNKSLKLNDDNSLKYKVPFGEIQDLIGARVVVYYKMDVESASAIVEKFFQRVEHNDIIPDNVSKFGYEGRHFICSIPSAIYSNHRQNTLIPDFFELQIKTLYQHAWSQAEHGLGYKTDKQLTYDEERKLAFIAAQSWGADTMLVDLVNAQKN